MTKPQGGLGRGLGALFPSENAQVKSGIQKKNTKNEPKQELADGLEIRFVSPMDIDANPHQPRKNFNRDELENLMASIKEHGILQPLVVTEKDDGRYELIAGERRLRSSREIGLKEVPVVVRGAMRDQQKLELALIENIQRQELNAVEEAEAYDALADLFSLTQAQIAERVGKSRSYVANIMRLLDLEEDMLQALIDGKISKSHARTLLGEKDLTARRNVFNKMLSGGMTVREAEVRATKPRVSNREDRDQAIEALQKELMDHFGTKVSIQMKHNRGKLSIHFYSRPDLKEIIKKILK